MPERKTTCPAVVHVVATAPAASLDLLAWCHMTGHTCLGPVRGTEQPTYALRLTAGALPATHAGADGIRRARHLAIGLDNKKPPG